MGVGVSVASVALGATVIEKHFTLNRADGGVDSSFSMEPAEMAQLVMETERAWPGAWKSELWVQPRPRKKITPVPSVSIHRKRPQARRCADQRECSCDTSWVGLAYEVFGSGAR